MLLKSFATLLPSHACWNTQRHYRVNIVPNIDQLHALPLRPFSESVIPLRGAVCPDRVRSRFSTCNSRKPVLTMSKHNFVQKVQTEAVDCWLRDSHKLLQLPSSLTTDQANVVLNLFKCLEIDAVARVKLRKRLSGKESELDCTSSGAPSTCSGSHNLTKPLTYMGEYSSKKSLSWEFK